MNKLLANSIEGISSNISIGNLVLKTAVLPLIVAMSAFVVSTVSAAEAETSVATPTAKLSAAPVANNPQINAEKNKQPMSSDNMLSPLNLKTVLLDKPTREKIDRQRALYLNPEVEKPPEVITPPPQGKGNSTPKKKSIYLPYKLTVSAVVKKPDGSALVRINDKYNQTRSNHILIDEPQSGPKGVVLQVIDQETRVPVGQTLLPRKMKTVDNYKIAQQEKKKALPQTKDKATENRLKEVQIITGDAPKKVNP